MTRFAAALIAAAALAGCTAKDEGPMPLMKNAPAARAGIPPIDAAAPAAIETATFALG